MSQTTSKRKSTIPKQALPVHERVQRHFKSLVAQIEGNCLQNTIKTCDKILRLEPNTIEALQTKLILLLQTEQYKLALELAQSLRDSNRSSFQSAFGMAYALYRLNRELEASDVANSITPNGEHESRALMHLKAQIAYRLGNYQKAVDLYTHIFDTAPEQSDEQSDSLTNLTAAQTHLNFLRGGFQQSLHSLPQNVVDSLEDAPPPVIIPPTTTTVPVSVPVSSTNKADAPVVKKVRASRVPKGVIPGVTPPPDPERWLKKNQRTNVHHSGKRRKAGANMTQGSVIENTLTTSVKGKKKK
ncbi:hypothetical protein Clacol_002637 [Clathrus columnatus]|uniref:Signal recognition particle subunit SRP72 n=1 Tax=Clathrus columnatus TaxID=1419009 RepID=A0AAV5A781_9AGAM|nr:hypothetical protein Clacol_002637 [Clathrus columnatus]